MPAGENGMRVRERGKRAHPSVEILLRR